MDFPDFAPEYCPECGGELGEEFRDGKQRLYCMNCEKVKWLNPDIASGFIVKDEGKVLLQKRKIEPHAGKWSIPAGFLELGEEPFEGAVRELEEETGLKFEGEKQFVDFVNLKHPDGNFVIVAVFMADFEECTGKLEPEEEEVEKLEFWKIENVFEKKEKLDYEDYLELIRNLM